MQDTFTKRNQQFIKVNQDRWDGPDIYENKSKAIRLVVDAEKNDNPISLANCSDDELEFKKEAREIQKLVPNSIPQNTKDLQLYHYQIEQGMYMPFSSASENSDDNTIDPRFLDLGEVIQRTKGTPTTKIVYFVMKYFWGVEDPSQYNVKLNKLKGYEKKIPFVIQIEHNENMALYQVQIISSLQRFQFQLESRVGIKLNNLIKSQELSFTVNNLLTGLNFSFDAAKGTKIPFNMLQELVVFTLLINEDLISDVFTLAKNSSNKIIEQKMKIDGLVNEQIKKSNTIRKNYYLQLINELLGKIEWGSPIETNKKYLKQLMIDQIQDYKPSCQSATEKELLKKIVQFIFEDLSSPYEKQTIKEKIANQTLSEIIKVLFANKETSLVRELIESSYKIGLDNIANIFSFDTILDFFAQSCADKHGEYAASILTTIHYYCLVKEFGGTRPLKIFCKYFGDKNFDESEKSYSQYLQIITEMCIGIYQLKSFQFEGIQGFLQFFEVYSHLKEHICLVKMVDCNNLIKKMRIFIQKLINKIFDPDFLKIVKLLYITQFNQKIIENRLNIVNLSQAYLNEFAMKQNGSLIISEIFYQLLKKKLYDYANTLGKSIFSEYLKKNSQDVCLHAINKQFSINIIEQQKAQEIFKQLMSQVLNFFIKREKIKDIIANNKWHNNFRYKRQINQLLLQQVVQHLDVYKDKMQQRIVKEKLQKLITTNLNNKEEQDNLISIIHIDTLELTKQKIMDHILNQKNRLHILQKIIKKKNQRSDILIYILQEINDSLKEKKISYQELIKITESKPYEKLILCRIMNDQKFIETMIEYKNQVLEYLSFIKKMTVFLKDMERSFNLTDVQKYIGQLKEAEKQVQNKSILNQKIQIFVPELQYFNNRVLDCYLLPPFFMGVEKTENITLQTLVQKCNYCLAKFINSINELINLQKQDKLLIESINFLNVQSLSEQTFKKILLWQSTDFEICDDLIQIFSVIKKTQVINKQVKAIDKFMTKMNTRLDQINSFSSLINNIRQGKPTTNISGICKAYKLYKNCLDRNKLGDNNERAKQITNTIILSVQNQKEFQQILSLQRNLQDMKGHIDEEDDQELSLTVPQIEYCQDIIEYIVKVWQSSENLDMYMKKIKELLKKKKTIGNKLKSVINNIGALKKLKDQIKNKNLSSQNIMICVIRKSQILVDIDQQLIVVFKINTYDDQNKLMSLSKEQIAKNREKAIVNLAALENKEQNVQIIKSKQNILTFLNICQKFDRIIKLEQNLASLGNIVIQKIQKKCVIKDGDTEQLDKYVIQRQKQSKQWNDELNKLYDMSYKATLLQGKKIKGFYEFLINDQKNNTQFTGIGTMKIIEQFRIKNKQTITRSKSQKKRTPKQCFQLLKLYFNHLQKCQKAQRIQAADRNQQFIDLIIFSQETRDFTYGMALIGKERLDRLKRQNVLFCCPQTGTEELRSFIERALRDIDTQYVIIDYKHLSPEKQRYLIDRIKEYRETNELKIKLCLVSDSELQKICEFAKQLKSRNRTIGIESIESTKSLYNEYLQRQSKKTKIYCSPIAGLGKTYQITKDCKRNNLNPIFFPISGQVKEIQLYDRLLAVTKKLNDSPVGFIIQLHQVSSHKIINNFITSIVLWGSFSSNGQSASLPEKSKIYIEIQNVNTFNHFKFLPFLKQINSVKNIVEQVGDIQKIDYDFEDKKKFYFTMYHLDLIDSRQIETADTENFNQFNYQNVIQNFNDEKIQRLLSKFFTEKMKSKAQRPTFYQYHYFKKLLFQSFCNFSNSFFLKKAFIKQQYDEKSQLFFKLNTIRQDFIEVLVDNALQFIQRTVPLQQFDVQQMNPRDLALELNSFPFFIIPNQDKQTFSFIYTDDKEVPETIKNFIITQTPHLIREIMVELNKPASQKLSLQSMDAAFAAESLNNLEANNDQKNFDAKITQILKNVSNNRHFNIKAQGTYVINLDNFFKMCLIAQRMTQNIPIVIMGEAGVGKTAILRYIVTEVYQHYFHVVNINAGTTIDFLKNQLLKIEAQSLKAKLQKKKLWVFFDEFNTFQSLGYIKELIMEKRFLGEKREALEDCVIMAACNPFRNRKQDGENKKTQLAFKVFPPPDSVVECMWNYGELKDRETEKYAKKILCQINYKIDNIIKCIMFAHQKIKKWVDISAVSLRDIQRFRLIFDWFKTHLPSNSNSPVPQGIRYENKLQRAFIMTFNFCYILRFSSPDKRKKILQEVEKTMDYSEGYINKVKQFQEKEFFMKLSIKNPTIAENSAIKQNLFTSFVCIYNRLPLIIVGNPGCSKTLAVRILVENLKGTNSQNAELKKLNNIRCLSFQGTETCNSSNLKSVFDKAQKIWKQRGERDSIPLIVFDQIGLAEKSPDNPLKVLHPYLEIDKGVTSKEGSREIAFIGISNWQLDISKMSRFLILHRPNPTQKDLTDTAVNMCKANFKDQSDKANSIVKDLSISYFNFINEWTIRPINDYRNFFGLRDFYSLIKSFLEILEKEQISLIDNQKVTAAIEKAIFRNFNGKKDSAQDFIRHYCDVTNVNYRPKQRKYDIFQLISESLRSKNGRCPLAIVPDSSSLSYLKYRISQEFKNSSYIEGSTFQKDKNDKNYILRSIGAIEAEIGLDRILVMSKINPSVQTSLYDLFNKYYVERAGQKICKITNESGLTSNRAVHQSFNCLVIIDEKDINQTEVPFLNRFQKYGFSILNYNSDDTQKITQKIQSLAKRVLAACKKFNFNYQKEDLFVNSSNQSIRTLAMKVCIKYKNQKLQILYQRVLRQFILNSTQDFKYIYTFFLEKENDFTNIEKQLIKSSLQSLKIQQLIQYPESIVFTTEASQTCKQISQKYKSKEIDIIFYHNEEALYTEIKSFFQQKQQYDGLIIKLSAKAYGDKLNYLASLFEKAKKQTIHRQSKRIFLVLNLDRTTKNVGVIDKPLCISYLTEYNQFLYDKSSLKVKAANKEQFFANISMKTLLINIKNLFQFSYQKEDEVQKLNQFFSGYLRQIFDDGNLFSEHCKQVIYKIQGLNFNLKESDIATILSDPNTIKQCRNIKQALTKHLAKNQFEGLLSVFIKYLVDREVLFSYSLRHSLKMLELQIEDADILKKIVSDRNFKIDEILTQMIEQKTNTIKNDYNSLKRMRTLPSINRKAKVTIKRLRLFPFSKFQSEMIFNKENSKKNFTVLAQECFENEKQRQQSKENFTKFYREKTTLNIKTQKGEIIQLHHQIDRDQIYSMLLMTDILIDFLQNSNISIKYCLRYYKLMEDVFKIYQNFEDRAKILIGKGRFWIGIFKIFEVFFENGISEIDFSFKSKESKINKTVHNSSLSFKQIIRGYTINLINFLITNIQPQAKNIKKFKTQQNYYDAYLKIVYQLQNMLKSESKVDQEQKIQKLLINRDLMVFLGQFDQKQKYNQLRRFSEINQPQYFEKIYYFLNQLRENGQKTETQLKAITQFSANRLFAQWFKDKSSGMNCYEKFLKQIDLNPSFGHNSVYTINYILNFVPINYEQPQNIDQYLSEYKSIQILQKFGQNCQQKGYRNNLSILFSNIFTHKFKSCYEKKKPMEIIHDKHRQFVQIFNKSKGQTFNHPLSKIFGFSFIKLYLENYIEILQNQRQCAQLTEIDKLLSQNGDLPATCRFYCLKLLRTKIPTKQIDMKFMKIKRCEWAVKMKEQFKQTQSKSFMVPSVTEQCSQKLIDLMKQFQGSGGSKVDFLKQMFNQASLSPQNKYNLLSFFMKYIYSKSCNENYVSTIKKAIQDNKQQFITKIGVQQFKLIECYTNSQLNKEFKITDPKQINEEQFLILNCINWLFATRKSSSCLTSLFFDQNGDVHNDIFASIETQFVLCGPENPFANIAQGVITMTRNNNIGVYLCCKDCDYIYSHENCGWPSDTYDCPMCGQKIGNKPGQSHSISREDQGARRITSKLVVDKKSQFYVGSSWNGLHKVELYWQGQRSYIKEQINRMKKKPIIMIRKKISRLTGFEMQNNDRTSDTTFRVMNVVIHSLLYGLLSLGVIKEQDGCKLLKTNNNKSSLEVALIKINQNLNVLKQRLDIQSKFNGWMYGMCRQILSISLDFKKHKLEYNKRLVQQNNQLAKKFRLQVEQKKVKDVYFPLFLNIAEQLEKGLGIKDIVEDNVLDGTSCFNRDIFQYLIQQKIKLYAHEKKIQFGSKNQSLQGKLQYPFQVFLLEDQIDQAKFAYSRIFKLPQKQIKIDVVVKQFEIQIKQSYPFLQYILNKPERLDQISNFYILASFINKLMKEVQNKKTREEVGKITLAQYLKELQLLNGQGMAEQLKDPIKFINAWRMLSGSLGVLQNGCKVIGKMNNEYSTETILKAFLLDLINKQNYYGAMIGSVYHNLSKNYNQVLGLLNSCKNRITRFKNINMISEQYKIHPQNMRQDSLILITTQQIERQLYNCSIGSVIYGQNISFHNFQALQENFIQKLNGKCQLMSQIQDFKSICFNGEAFSQRAQSSNTIAQVRKFAFEDLTQLQNKKINQYFIEARNKYQQDESYYNHLVGIRGIFENIMINLKNLQGNWKVRDIIDFIREYKIEVTIKQFTYSIICSLPLTKIIPLFETLQKQMKIFVLKKLPEKYKEKIEKDHLEQIQQLLLSLPLQDSQFKPTIQQFGNALFRFICRNLQSGQFDPESIIIHFLPEREDFWPPNYMQQKIYELQGEASLSTLNMSKVFSLLLLVDSVIEQQIRR